MVATTITVAKSATLDLNGHTLYSSANRGIVIANGTDADNKITFTLKATDGGTINHTLSGSPGKGSRNTAAVHVGEYHEQMEGYNSTAHQYPDTYAVFKMEGGIITSNSGGICMADKSEFEIQDGCSVTSNKSCAVYFGDYGNGGSKLTMTGGKLESNGTGATIQISGNLIGETTEINISGGTIVHKNNTQAVDDQTAILSGGCGDITISKNAKVVSDGVAIEMRAGSLDIQGGTIAGDATINSTSGEIKANEDSSLEFGKSESSATFSKGAAVVVSQHRTGKNIDVDISGGEISGYTALAISDPEASHASSGYLCGNPMGEPDPNDTTKRIVGKVTVDVTGGTLKSTGTDAFNFESIGTVKLDDKELNGYKVTGKNAVVALDDRVTVNISNTEVIGNLLASQRTASQPAAYGTLANNTYTVFEDNVTADNLFTAETKEANSIKLDLQAAERWNATGTNQFIYYTKANGATTGTGIATIAAASGSNLELKTSTSTNDTVDIDVDFTKTLFTNTDNLATTFNKLDASTASNKFNFNVTANNTGFKSIFGGLGNDTITAPSIGAALNGGAGNDYLIGGAGNDTFIFSGGSDTIQDYVYGTDAVSLGEGFVLPTSFDSIDNSDSSNFVLAFSNAASLTFRPIAELQIAKGNDTYSYTSKSIALDNKNSHGISLGAGWTSDFNGTKEAYENYATIDAAEVEKKIQIRGNDNANSIVGGKGGGTLLGGDNNDTLVAGGRSTTLNGGDGADLLIGNSNVGNYNLFVYSAGKDSIENYKAGDLINVTGRDVSFSEVTATKSNDDLLIKFDDSNSMSIKGGATLENGISVASGRRTYLFKAGSIALDKSITLTSDFEEASFDKGDAYDTINAAAVTKKDISIKGNANANYLVGSTDKKNTLDGGAGNDTLVGGTVSAEDTFIYSAGKDVIENFNAANDKLSIDSTKIESGKATSNKLTFTINKKSGVLTFNFGDSDAIEKVSLQGGGYLTKDGYVSGDTDKTFKLFSSAKGNITVGGGTGLYSGVSTVDAEAVTKQGVTLVGGEGGLYKFKDSNKQKDGFTYGGGSASISGYEGGRDRIDFGTYSYEGFKITSDTDDVVLNLKSGDTTGSISIDGAVGKEVLLRENNKNSKLVFKADGVLENKAKNPTMATVSASYNFATNDNTVKKIFAVGSKAISIQAGNKSNTIINASDMSVKTGTVSLSGGNKNDKLIGSSNADMYIYGAGKDVIQGFGSSDSISLTVGDKSLQDSLTSAKITQSNSTIKFKFDNKNTLTIKADKENTTFKNGQLQINDTNYTYQKNAVQATNGTVSLTSNFGGTFKTLDATQQTIDGGLVKNNLTFVGSTRDEKFIGSDANKKTTFKGGGGADTLVGGASKDTFFYAKSYTGDAVIQSFDFKNDKLKVASGKIGRISSISGGGGIVIGMTSGQKNSSAIVGSFKITSQKPASDTDTNIDTSKVAFKANNTYYWFAEDDDKYVSADDGTTAITAGQLITTENRISNVSALPITEASVIDLNYSTNLVKAGVAVKVTSATPKTTT